MESEEKSETTRQIEKYIQGRMTPTESADFERVCRENEDFNEQYHLQLLTHWAIWTAGQEDQKTNLRKIYQEISSEKKRISVARRKWFSLAAVVLILVAVAGISVSILRSKRLSPEALFSAYYEVPRAPETLGAGGDREQLNQMYAAYRKGDYLRYTEKYREQLLIDTTKYSEADFYFAISLLELHAPTEAAEVLDRTSFVPEQTMWYKALARLKASDLERTRTILDSIIRDPGHYYHNQAVELQRKLP
ncbi:MAG: hypothetical protein SF052_14995 [Bacteroidia bacterium]|nr:hypothetical protein [Bacteroidia bacterium]